MGRRRKVILAGLAIGVLVLAAALLQVGPFGPPALPAGAAPLSMATEAPHFGPTLGCETALLAPVRVTAPGSDLILLNVATGQPARVVWPSGFQAWRLGGQARVIARDGSVFAREGDVLTDLGGGVGVDDAFHICIIGM